jgi:hypothetical protein
MNNVRQIHIGLQGAALDFDNTAIVNPYPVDLGIKTNLEYITYLVKNGVFKESDLSIFCWQGTHVTSLKDLRAEDLAYRFANRSSKDESDPDMIFLISNGPMPETKAPWYVFWHRSFRHTGQVVVEMGGSASFYTQPNLDIKQLGHLPPRDPPFLQ